MVHTPIRPSAASRFNTIIVPSGEYVEANSRRRVPSSSVWFDPSASIDQMFLPFLENVIELPSGDQSGRSSTVFGPVVRRTGSEPSASMTQMSSAGVARLLLKAIFDPSGDHSGNASKIPFVNVSWTGSEPSASMTQMSWNSSDWFVVKAIFVPSGDQAGQVSWTFGVNVSRVRSKLSVSMTQISQFWNSPRHTVYAS